MALGQWVVLPYVVGSWVIGFMAKRGLETNSITVLLARSIATSTYEHVAHWSVT